MKRIALSDVGDGLCSVLSNSDRINVQIDWGGSSSIRAINGWQKFKRQFYYPKSSPDVFILSHFHQDHFNGLMYASEKIPSMKNSLSIREVYFPGQPKFPDSRELYFALLAIARYTIGDNSGHMGIDLIGAVERLNRFEPASKVLFQNDVFYAGDMRFKCLWPPKDYNNQNFTKAVGRALSAFNKALEENELLKAVHSTIVEEDIFSHLNDSNENPHQEKKITNEGDHFHMKDQGNFLFDDFPFSEYDRPLENSSFKEANKLLRGVANRLCLVLLQEDFLFWGDLESREIKIVVNNLINEGYNDFELMIAPHHGTHWHDDLMKLRTRMMLIPNGERLHAKFKQSLKHISQKVISTHMNGDIIEFF